MVLMVSKLFKILVAIAMIFMHASAYAQLGDQLGVANPLLGRTGTAGKPSIDAMAANPAQAGEIARSKIQLVWGVSSVRYSQRYPGFKAHTSNTQGLEPGYPIPRFVWKPTRNFGIGGLIIPVPVGQDIDVKDMPMVIMGQQNSVDMTGKGTLNGLAHVVAGYRFSQGFSLGANFSYSAISASGDIVPTGSSSSLASFVIKTTNMEGGLGFKLKIDRLTLGAWTNIFTTSQGSTNFESILADDAGKEDEGNTGTKSTSNFLDPIRLGLGLDITPKWFVTTDVQYNRANKSEMRFSVVDFEEKPLDSYDTVSVFVGSEVQYKPNTELMFGYFNEPGSVGPGSPGEDGKAGFGFFDLALNQGKPPSTPIWGLGAGARYHFKKVGRKRRTRYQMAIEGGFVFAETSIGIDEDGEQPGAYLVQRYQFPLKFIYQF